MATFTNNTGVTFPTSGTFTTSQTVNVTGLTGTVATVSVTFTGLTHNLADDLDFLLVAPDGSTNLVFWSDAGGNNAVSNATFTIADTGATVLPDGSGLASGTTYRPANNPGSFGQAVETGASFGNALTLNHASGSGTATFSTVFTGLNPNGEWRLYILDDADGDGGSLASWSLNVTAGSVSTVGDKVFKDVDGDGIQDAGEQGVDGVTVQLLDAGNNVLQTTTTAGGGSYNFTNVADGTYSVKFITPGGTNYAFTSQDQGGNDALDSDANASGQTAQFTVSGSNITNIDAGLRDTRITGTAFGDLDQDGIQDAGETGVDGATVRLLNSSNVVVATTTTGNGGTYDFGNVTPGTYSLEFVAPSSFAISPKDAGGNDATDSDANPATGRTDQFSVSLGQTVDTVDAGVYATGGFGTYTFSNTTGVTFSSASVNQTVQTITIGGVTGPIADVKIHINGLSHNLLDDLDFWLVGPDGSSNLLLWSDVGGNTPGGPINIVLSDSGVTALPDNGGLSSGTFKPGDYTGNDGSETAGTFGAGGPTLVHAAPSGIGTFAGQFTGLSPNGTWTLYARDDAGGDAGSFTSWSIEVTTASVSVIGDKVFEDLNGNGIQDAGEAGVNGITVQLLDNTDAVVATTSTANGGLYSFTNVLDGTYSVKFVIPGGSHYTFTSQDQGGNDALDSDANASGQTAQFSVSGSNVTNVDAGLRGTHIGNTVFGDLDRDGIQDAGEAGLDGVTVNLLDSGNNVVATTETANGGRYDFANVAPGTYSVKVDLPSQFSFSPRDAGGNDAADSDVDTGTGQSGQFTVALGETVDTVDAGVYATNGIGTFTFTNDNGVTFPTANPAVIAQTFSVGGVQGGISEIKVHINGLSHNLLDDLDFLLVGPDGTSNLLFWSDAGGNNAGGPFNIVIADSGGANLADATSLSSGTFRPTDHTTGIEGLETAASFGLTGFTVNHATPGGSATFASAFSQMSPNGTWTLYLRDDAGGDAGTITSWSLEITTVQLNEAPEIDLDSVAGGTGYTASFTEDGAAVAIAGANVTISDADNAALSEATITITDFAAGDVLAFTSSAATGDIAVQSNAAGTLVLTSAAGATLAQWQAALQAVTYENTTNAPGSSRTVTVQLDDGEASNSLSNIAMTTITITQSNDAPSISAATLAAVNEDATNPAGATIASLFAGNFSDPDDPAAAITGILISANPQNTAEGTWQYSTDAGANWFDVGAVSDGAALALNAAALVRFVPAADFTGTPSGLGVYGVDDTFAGGFTAGSTRVAVDATVNGADTAISDAATTLGTSVDAINDGPVITAPGAVQAVGEDADLVFNAANGNRISIADADVGSGMLSVVIEAATGTLTLGSIPAGLTFLTGDGSADVRVAFWANLADINTALNGLIYRGDPNATGPSNILISVTDNGNNGADPGTTGTSIDEQDTQSVSISIAAVNDAPAFAGLDAVLSITEGDAPAVLDANAVMSDVELDAAGSYDGATLTLRRQGGANTGDVFGGSGTLSFVAGDVLVGATNVGTVTNAAGTLTITFNASATPALVDEVLQQITYQNTSDDPPASVQIEYSLNDGNTGAQGSGGAGQTTRAVTVNIAGVNDPVTGLSFANSTASLAENISTAAARKVADIVVADPDGGNTLSLSGADAHLFQIVGTELRLRAGVRLDFETNSTLDLIVSVDDPSTVGAPDISTPLTISVTDVNEAPSLALTSRLISLSENASTATARKVANIVITDDALGSEKLTLTGADASLFQIVGTELRLKAGVKLDFETNPKLDVKVVMNDTALPGIEGQLAMAIRIINVNEARNGTSGNDRLTGTAAADRINGLAGNDTINGGGGNDTITGGIGVDVMTGGAGADTFVFLSFRDSAPNQPGVVGNGGFVADQGLGKRDIITDFVSGVDRIDLSAIDANTHIAGNQKFGWKGAAGFSFSAGELVYKTFNFAGTANDQTIIYGDIDGNGAADFQIQLKGIKTLSAADFVL